MTQPKKPPPKAPPIPPMRLRDEEIAALARMAWGAWESGTEHATTDRVGGVWVFTVEREPVIRLRLQRTDSEGVVAQEVTGQELGIEAVEAMLASRVLAMAEPALARVNSRPAAPL